MDFSLTPHHSPLTHFLKNEYSRGQALNVDTSHTYSMNSCLQGFLAVQFQPWASKLNM